MLALFRIGFFGEERRLEIFGPQTATSNSEPLVLLLHSTHVQGAHERKADTPVDLLSPENPLGPNFNWALPDGDVTLELRGDYRPFQFLVASQILCVASPYFRDMPGPVSTFKRACDLRRVFGSESGPWTIVTWGGDPRALAVLLYALHFRSEKVPRTVSFNELWELAALCDKYGCASAMEPWITMWTRELPQHKGHFSECLVKWMSMARIFGRDDLFEKVTREIILEGRYFGRIPADDHLAMPSYVRLSDPRFLIPRPVICKPISSTGSPQLINVIKLYQPVSESAETRYTDTLLLLLEGLERYTNPLLKPSVGWARKYAT